MAVKIKKTKPVIEVTEEKILAPIPPDSSFPEDDAVDNYINFYKSYLTGKLKGTGKNRTLNCPFCEKADHFSFDIISGQAKCLVCDESCNHYSFLTKFHQAWLDNTEPSWYEELELARGISAKVFEEARFAYDSYRERWLVPYYKPGTDSLLNLGYFRTDGDKPYRIWKSPNVKGLIPLSLYMPFKFNDDSELMIFEGEWDTLAGKELFPESNIVGVPGAGIFPDSSLKYIIGKSSFRLCYDYNDAGTKGTVKAASQLLKYSTDIEYLNWNKYTKATPGMDIRDLLTTQGEANTRVIIQGCFTDANKLPGVSRAKADEPEDLSPGYLNTIDEIKKVTSLEEYFRKYEKHMLLNDTNRDAIKLGLAISTCQYMPGEPVWSFFVGRASDGKTTFIESFGGTNEYFDYASKITASNLVSGWNSGGDSSFLPQLAGKCFFIKDFTVVLGEPADVQKKLFNLLRDIYDGSIKIRFGNNVERNYHNTNFNMIAGVTYAIQKHNDAAMGERFLRIDYSGKKEDKVSDNIALDTAIGNFGSTTTKKKDLTEATLGYVKYVRENDWDITNFPVLCEQSRKMISALARYASQVRTQPDNDRNEGIKYRPRVESPYRIALQFTKVGYALQKVLDPTNQDKYYNTKDNILTLSPEVCRLLTKLTHDTIDGFGQEIIKYVYKNPRSTREQIRKALHIPDTRCHRVITDLQFMKLVVKSVNLDRKVKRGPEAEVYVLGSSLREIMKYMTDYSSDE